MERFVDYYVVLGISRETSVEEVRKAWIDKCYILHPDRMQGAPDTAKKKAEAELKEVNQAYEVLSNPRKRKAYDAKLGPHDGEQKDRRGKPRPVVEPQVIEFRDLQPGEARSASFDISNAGGSYSSIWFSNPDTWVRVMDWHSLSASDELPLRVRIEVIGPEEGRKFSENILVKLDNEEARLAVSLTIKKKPNNIISKLLGKKLRPPFALVDHEWHNIEYKHLPDWIKNRREKLDAGEELVGRVFRYRRGDNSRTYQIRLRDDQERGEFHTRKLTPPFTLSDHEWHDIDQKYLTHWVKKRKDRIKAGGTLVGKTFEYRLDSLSGSCQIRLKQNQKKGTYRG